MHLYSIALRTLSINQVSFHPFCTFQDIALTGIHYANTKLRGDNSVKIQGRIMVLVHCLSSHCHLSINQVPFNPFCTFQDMARTGNNYEKWLRGDKSINIQGRIMVLLPFPSLPSIYKPRFIQMPTVVLKVIRQTRYRTDERTDKAGSINDFFYILHCSDTDRLFHLVRIANLNLHTCD